MNQLTTVQSQIKNTKFNLAAIAAFGESDITMGTKEIADMLGVKHADLKISAERLFERGVIGKNDSAMQKHEFKIANGNTYTEYRLNKRDSMTLVAQNCPEFTGELVDRWLELEQKTNAGSIAMTMNSAQLRLLTCEVEKKEQAIAYIESVKPKVDFYDQAADADGTFTLEEAAKLIGTGRTRLIQKLREHGYFMPKTTRPYQKYVGRYFELKFRMINGERVYSSALVTSKGMLMLHEEIKKWEENTLSSIGLH